MVPERSQTSPQPVVCRLVVRAAALDEVESRLWMLDTTGIAAETGEDGGQVTVHAGFNSPDTANAAVHALGDLVNHHTVVAPDGSELDAWRPFAQNVTLADGLTVVVTNAAATSDAKPGVQQVLIDPGRSFGYGAHPTSRLAMEEVARRAPGVKQLLDVGSGSGVLGVVGLVRGAAELTAVDNDAEARRCTAANLALNKLAHRSGPVHLDLRDVAGTFDLAVANVEAPALEEMVDDLCDRVSPGGTLVLGGILQKRWPPLEERLRSLGRPLDVVAAPVLDGWIGPVVRF